MLRFSPKARQLIDHGVMMLPPAERQLWFAWTADHPDPRAAGEPADDGRGLVPPEVIEVVLAALEAQLSLMERACENPSMSEDEFSDLDNNLAHLRSVERAVRANVALYRTASKA
jgi:hypothetical protein